ncbi:MAG: EamA family transporter [Patescibacteria group bacterium]
MAWLAFSVFGYFLNSIAIAIDKTLLRRAIPHPAAYAFAVAGLGGIVIPALPFVNRPPGILLFASLAAGAIFTLALFLFYKLLQESEASRVTPLVGGLTPVVILILGWFFLGETLTLLEIAAFALILFGSVIVSRPAPSGYRGERRSIFLPGLIVATVFAVSYAGSKFVYVNADFIGALLWRTAGSAAAAFALLLSAENRRAIIGVLRAPRESTTIAFVGGQSAGAASFVLVNYALSIGHTAIVNALAGLQYVFLFLIVLGFGRSFPAIREHIRGSVASKVAGVILIGGGIALLAFT